ncbi:MAG: hypothetical protein KA185_15430 [Vitreoscilla sp.]|nr:hypothetical protein [Vitreoscilla sp.]
MPNRVPWNPDFSIGHELIDAQHQGLLTQCNRLADLCVAGASDGDESGGRFDQACDDLKALVRKHFETEAALLTGGGGADALEDQRIEGDEFEYLAGEVATAENFDRLERQRFLALWCVGHITGSAEQQRAFLAARDDASD